MLPTLVIVGRPNVGKSTLFNRLTQSRAALVADFPGLTRDRHYGRGRGGDRPYLVVDTGGFEPKATTGIMHAMAKQTRTGHRRSRRGDLPGRRLAKASPPQDKIIADLLRRSGRPVLLAVNKAEGMAPERATAEFHELALGTPLPDLVGARRERPRPGRRSRSRIALRHAPTTEARRRAKHRRASRSPSSAGRTSASRR